jgi:hypothetical protein
MTTIPGWFIALYIGSGFALIVVLAIITDRILRK